MGRLTAAMLGFFRFLRKARPKYSLEVFFFNTALSGVGIACTLLGEQRLWAIAFSVLCFSVSVHFWRFRRAVKRDLAWLDRSISLLEQAISAYEREYAHEYKPVDLEAVARLREEIVRVTAEIVVKNSDSEIQSTERKTIGEAA